MINEIPTEYYYPTIIVKYEEVSTFSKVYGALIERVIKEPTAQTQIKLLFIVGATPAEAKDAILSMSDVTKIMELKSLHD